MAEVSCLACHAFVALDEHGVVELDRLVEDISISKEKLLDSAHRISWDLYARLWRRANELAGGEEALLQEFESIEMSFVVEPLARLAPLLANPADLYFIGARWYGPMTHTGVRFDCVRASAHELIFTVELPEKFEVDPVWFKVVGELLRSVPTFVGAERARVEIERLEGRIAVYRVNLPADGMGEVSETPSPIVEELERGIVQTSATLKALSDFEDAFGDYLQATPALVAMHRDGVVLYANPSLRTVLGNPRLPFRIEDYLREGERERWIQILDPVKPGAANSAEIVLETPGGARHVLAFGVGEMRWEGARVAMLNAFDITERVESRSSLEAANKTLQLLTETLPDLVARINREGELLDFMAGGGFPATNMLEPFRGTRFIDLVKHFIRGPKELREAHGEAISEAISTGSPLTLETQVWVADERDKAHVEVRILSREDETLMLMRDITDRRNLQRQLALSDRLASLGMVAAGVGHEINNPLTWIHGNLMTLIDEIESGEELDRDMLLEALRDTLDGARRIGRIADELKVFGRSSRVENEQIPLEKAIENALRLTTNEIRFRAEIEIDVAAQQWVKADESKLVQVLINLLSNAAHAIEPQQPEGAIRVTSVEEGEMVVMTVADNGRGMPLDQLERAFDPFYTTKTKTGTGLGLPIVRRLVSEMGGSIELESTPGVGTRAVVRLPAAEGGVESEPTPITPGERQLRSIAIIDDERDLLEALRRLLRRNDVHLFESGAAFLASGLDPDVILCDVMMPEQGGADLWAAFEERGLGERVVWMTGGAFTERAISFLDNTDQPIVDKPLTLEELYAAFARVESSRSIRHQQV